MKSKLIPGEALDSDTAFECKILYKYRHWIKEKEYPLGLTHKDLTSRQIPIHLVSSPLRNRAESNFLWKLVLISILLMGKQQIDMMLKPWVEQILIKLIPSCYLNP